MRRVEWECAVIRSRPGMSGTRAAGDGKAAAEHSLQVRLEQFAWEAVTQESARLGVSVEELLRFAVMYYLADVDSGRIARRISAPQPPPSG